MTPGSKRPELPPFRPPEQVIGTILPPLELPPESGTEGLQAPQAKASIREIIVTGDALLPELLVREIVKNYEQRDLSFADIAELRDRLTREVIQAGYVTSGANVPDQWLANGVLEIQIVGGRVPEVRIETDGRLREGYLQSRIDPGDEPVNVGDLERRLQSLQQDDRIRSVTAALEPTRKRGESLLRVMVSEETPWWAVFEADNFETPAIGSMGGRIDLGWRNLTGFGDAISLGLTATEGLRDVEASYLIPLTRWDTTLELHAEGTRSEVIEERFEDLDIESRTRSYGFTLSQPLHRSLEQRAEIFVTGEWRQSESFLLGSPFSFVEGPEQGKAEISVVRLGASWSHRTRSQVLALSSLLSWGLPILGATQHHGSRPDGQFVAWLGQAQFAHRFAELLNTQLVARGDVQLTNHPLLGMEQFAVGGRYTVRGYRENTLVRDAGAVLSAEIRVPVWVASDGLVRLEVGPFIDAGWSWNEDRRTVGPRSLLGAGFGARVALTHNTHFQVYWGEDIRDIDSPGGDYDLQDDGLHLAMTVELP